ncbi:MAG TPA: nucleotidyltransferase family protein [Bacillota bacterium]|nr:nucleotidyltransferase family protein [Bacillota bacterium]
MTGAIVLAAGRSSRMGRSKIMLPLGTRPVLAWTLDHVLAAGIEDIVLVTGPDTPDPVAVIGEAPVRLAHNPRAREGMSTSIQVGLLALHPATDAAFVVLADQPTIGPDIYRALLERYMAGQPAIVAPVYRGEQGNPVLFDRSVFAELFGLEGDVGGRAVIRRDPARLAQVDIDRDPPPDVDTPDAYRRLAADWPH